MSTEYTLTYFNARGSGEFIRLILSYVGAKWTEIRIPFDEVTGALIPENLKCKMLFDQAPLLEFEGRRIVQTLAICRFLAKRYKLEGKDEFESANCDEIVDACRDIYVMFAAYFREKDEAKKAEGMKTTSTITKERFFKKFSEIVQVNGEFLVGNNFTWADIVVAHTVYQLETIAKIQLFADYPPLQAHMERVFTLPGIKEWIASRPETKF